MADKHGAHQTSEAHVISLCEDFCKSPSAPVGYMISQKLDMSTLVCGTVNGCGTPVLNMSSRITNVTGNEAGVGGGVVSGVNVGMCKPVENYAPKVRAEGQCLLRHDTVMEMNTAGPEGSGNTKGKIAYCKTFKRDSEGGEKFTYKKKKKIKEVELNGKKVTVYEVSGTTGIGSGKYVPGDGAIYLNEGEWGEDTLANELQHAEDDARDGTLNGVMHDENGNELSYLEAEARSDDASLEVLNKDKQKMSKPCEGNFHIFHGVCYFRYPKTVVRANAIDRRRKAMRKADKLIKEGKYAEARKIGEQVTDAKNYIEQALEIECAKV